MKSSMKILIVIKQVSQALLHVPLVSETDSHAQNSHYWSNLLCQAILQPLLQASLHSVPVAQWLEHCVSSAKVVGSIPREHMF